MLEEIGHSGHPGGNPGADRGPHRRARALAWPRGWPPTAADRSGIVMLPGADPAGRRPPAGERTIHRGRAARATCGSRPTSTTCPMTIGPAGAPGPWLTNKELRHSARPTGPTADEQLLESAVLPERPDALRKTDPWRVLRIMGEFVEGFEKLGDVQDARGDLRLGPHPGRRPATTWRRWRRLGCWPRPASRSSPAAGRGSWRRPTAARVEGGRRSRSAATSSCRTSRAPTPTSAAASTSGSSSSARRCS